MTRRKFGVNETIGLWRSRRCNYIDLHAHRLHFWVQSCARLRVLELDTFVHRFPDRTRRLCGKRRL